MPQKRRPLVNPDQLTLWSVETTPTPDLPTADPTITKPAVNPYAKRRPSPLATGAAV
jgi:hypothetical protein